MDDIEEGDQFANTSGNKLTVLMVKGIWVWVHYDSHILPSTVRKDSLLNPEWYTRVPPFEVGDLVEYIIPFSNITQPGKGRTLAIHGDRAWVKFEGHAVPLSPLISGLRKAA